MKNDQHRKNLDKDDLLEISKRLYFHYNLRRV